MSEQTSEQVSVRSDATTFESHPEGTPVQVSFTGVLTGYVDHLGSRKVRIQGRAVSGTVVVVDEVLLPPDALVTVSEAGEH